MTPRVDSPIWKMLVAWNSRYVELFRFPAELVRVGAPIEALLRYNARRGLLGPPPADEGEAKLAPSTGKKKGTRKVEG